MPKVAIDAIYKTLATRRPLAAVAVAVAVAMAVASYEPL